MIYIISDKQAAARIWREGQQKRCYIYRFMSTCTIEEKMIQRQLSKEGLQNIIDDKEQVCYARLSYRIVSYVIRFYPFIIYMAILTVFCVGVCVSLSLSLGECIFV
jgi:hypothetical protein